MCPGPAGPAGGKQVIAGTGCESTRETIRLSRLSVEAGAHAVLVLTPHYYKLSDKRMDKALRMFDDPSVKRLLEDKGDIDYPASLSSSVLKLVPKLAQFSPELIESLL